MLFEEARQAEQSMSLATIYNTLRQFTEAGLLRPIATDGTKSYFDTNVTDHHHFYLEARLIDIPIKVPFQKLPVPPEGYAIDRIDVVVRLRRRPKLRAVRLS
jgi:Fur family transcriptional regulator, iron response regulator